MRSAKIFLLVALFSSNLPAQPSGYYEKVKLAEAALKTEDWASAARAYTAAFEANQWLGLTPDRFNAARAWAMVGNADSAFFHLNRIAERANFDDFQSLQTNPQLASLRSDSRWGSLALRVKMNQPRRPQLARMLARTYDDDQFGRLAIDSVKSQFGSNSPEVQSFKLAAARQDSLNVVFVSTILDSLGWLGTEDVGEKGNSALFLVVQHAPLSTQEKYLPMMREAVKKGKARGTSLALLEDRVLMRNGKRQLYGSQVVTDPETGEKRFFPIEDVDNVDRRRAEVGLQPLAEYAQHFGITWDAAAIEKNRKLEPDK